MCIDVLDGLMEWFLIAFHFSTLVNGLETIRVGEPFVAHWQIGLNSSSSNSISFFEYLEVTIGFLLFDYACEFLSFNVARALLRIEKTAADELN